MNKKLFNSVMIVTVLLTLLGVNTSRVAASQPEAVLAALPNPGTMVPVPAGKYATYSGKPHDSLFPSSWGVVNAKDSVNSSIDFGYAGTVVAPLGGYLAILKDCSDHQVVVIRASSGWAVALAHVYINSNVRNKSVSKGQVIGKTVQPLTRDKDRGCGFGIGNPPKQHIHYTLMKWVQGKTIQYTEQSIVNTYVGPWIVKDTYLQGSKYNIKLGQVIK